MVVAPVDRQVHAAEVVDDGREPAHVDLNEMLDVDARVVLNRVDQERRAAVRVRRVDLVHSVAGDRDAEIAR